MGKAVLAWCVCAPDVFNEFELTVLAPPILHGASMPDVMSEAIS